MAKYDKWLGAGLGWVVTGNPLGGLLGFLTASMMDKGGREDNRSLPGVSELEVNLIVIASHLIKIDGKVSLEEIAFVKNFLNEHFDGKYDAKRSDIINHCLQKEYDLGKACDQLRMYAPYGTRVQAIHFLIELANSDGKMSERENYFIFRVAGYLNVNDVQFKRIKSEHYEFISHNATEYNILGLKASATFVEVRNAYRKLTLKYHPDRNHHLNEVEKKKLAHRLQLIREAYERIKIQRGEK